MKRHQNVQYRVDVRHPKPRQWVQGCSQQLMSQLHPCDERLYYCVRDESRSHDSPESIIACTFTLLPFVLRRHDLNAVVVESEYWGVNVWAFPQQDRNPASESEFRAGAVRKGSTH